MAEVVISLITGVLRKSHGNHQNILSSGYTKVKEK